VKHSDLQRFLNAGYTRGQVFEVLMAISMKTLSNYANHIAGTPLDAKFEPFAWEPART
jgi:alkylhydroperoxidase family enzyme